MSDRASKVPWSSILGTSLLVLPVLALLVTGVVALARRGEETMAWAAGVTLALFLLAPLAFIPMARRVSARRRAFDALAERGAAGITVLVTRSRWHAAELMPAHNAHVEGLICVRGRVVLFRRVRGVWTQVPTAGSVVAILRGDHRMVRVDHPCVVLEFDDGSVMDVLPDHLDRFSRPSHPSADALVKSLRAVFSAR